MVLPEDLVSFVLRRQTARCLSVEVDENDITLLQYT